MSSADNSKSKPSSQQMYLRSEAVSAVQAARRDGKKVVFTSGSFDLIHPGHVAYLQHARRLGDFLVVGINSDDSVSRYKDPRRPICTEQARASVVSALGMVDSVFIFPELNNNENINLLKPDVYVKAGDYARNKLSSAALVEAYGGSVVIAPFVQGYSSSAIIDEVIVRYGTAVDGASSEAVPRRQPAIFVDRDGTINEFVEFLSEPEKFKFYPNAIAGLLKLKQHGFRIIITTNQPGIGLGYFTREDFFRVNRSMLKGFASKNLQVDKVYFCPDSYAVESEFRKPASGMIKRAVEELNIDLTNSYVIGDMTIDLEFARRAGCRSVLVQTGKAGTDGSFDTPADLLAVDLLEAANKVIEDYDKRKLP